MQNMLQSDGILPFTYVDRIFSENVYLVEAVCDPVFWLKCFIWVQLKLFTFPSSI